MWRAARESLMRGIEATRVRTVSCGEEGGWW